MKKIIFVFLFLISTCFVIAQTTVIGPANNGNFENATPGTNWTIVNPADNARWFCGTQSKCSGTNGAYIGTASTNNNYVNTTTRRAHIYRDVTFPAGETSITLSFDWKGQGESTFDGLKVFLGSTGATPVANTAFTTTDVTAVQLGATWYNLQAACATVNITIPAANAGTTKRLVFSWHNDASGGTTPAATIDNVTIVTAPPPANDACAGSTLLTSGSSCTTTAGNTTSGYSASGMGCTAGTPDDDIWYSFVAVVSTHSVTVDGGADFDAVVGAYNTCGGTQPTGGACKDATGADGIETLTLTGLTPGTTYYLNVYDFATGGGNFTICVTHAPLCSGTPTAGTASASVTSATCSTSSNLSLSGHTTGSGITYQWQSSAVSGGPYTTIAGATSATYAATGISSTTYYTCVVTCTASGLSATSSQASVTINPIVGGTTVSSSASACSGTTFTLSITGNTTTGVTYQWQSSPDGSTWTNITGATASTRTVTQTAATYYQCIITCTANGSTVASSSLQVTMANFLTCYCASTAASSSDEDITNVTFGTINNTSACNSLTGTQGLATGSANLYSNFMNTVPVPNIQQATSYNISVTITECAGTAYDHEVRVYIDFNQNGLLTDAGEEFIIYPLANSNTHTVTYSIAIPVTATLGNTLMRVVCKEGTVAGPCDVTDFGETEDYKINITAAPACAGSPAGGTSTASVTSAACSTNSDITGAGYGTGSTGLSYQWQSSLNNSTWTNIAGATTPALYSATTVSVTTYYHLVTTCSNGGGTGTSTTSTVTISPVVAGTTVSSASPACSGTTFTLSLSGNTTTGVTYQWQSSPDGTTWTNIAGATSATLATSQTVATYYRCNITCTASATTVASSSLNLTMNLPSACYCTPAPSSVDGLGITNVTCGTINNTTVAEAGNYGDYSAQVTNFMDGSLVTVNITYSTGATYITRIWVDLNNDGDFADTGEEVYAGTSLAANPTTLVATFTLPLGTSLGNHRMRIGGCDISTPTPCYTGTWGSYEDYTLNITPLPVCSGAPTPGTATSTIANFCNSGTPTLATTGYTTGVSGIAFQWYQSATTGPYAWSQIPGAIAATYVSPSISQTTYYYCEVTCGASAASTNTLTVTNTAATITSTNNPVSVACGGAASLTATATGGTIKWYTSATGGTAVASGSPYAPVVTANTTYYVTTNSGGTTSNVGKPSYNGTDGAFGISNRGLRFDALSAFTLVSVDVYVTTAGSTLNIQLQDNTGAAIGAPVVTGALVAGLNTIPMNLSIPIGTQYRLVSTTATSLGRGSTGVAFPYTLPGVCSITSSEWGGSTTTYYYCFFNWLVSTGCETSPRTPVNVTVTGATAPVCSAYSSPTNGATGVCPVAASINWLASNTSCRAATSYLLYFGTDAAATNIMNGVDIGNVLTYNLGTLAGGTTYYWKIVPTNSGGNASGCTIQSFSTAANPGTICPGLLGTGVVSVASLPYVSGAGTTAGSVDDLTTANTTNCGSSSYTTGEDQVFYFTPSTSGTITINLTSTGSYTGLMLYDGCPLNTATCGAAVGACVASAQSSTGNKTLTACVIAGTTYYLVLDSWSTPSSNAYSNLTISAVTPLVIATNDLPCNANALTLGVTENGNNSCTGSASEPNAPSCWTSGTRNTIWYTVVAPASGQISVRTMLGTLLNTQIAMYQGACGSLTQVSPTSSSCNDNLTGCGSSEASQITVTGLTPGNTYYVVVDGATDQTGSFQIVAIDPSTQSFPSTPGQDCGIAFPTCNPILNISDPGYANTGSTCDFDGSDDCTSGERSSVWYNIVIGTNGFLTFDLWPNDYGGPGSGAGAETDYDFLVWKTGGAGATTCAGIQANSATGLVACNFSSLGVTGVSTTGNTPAFFSPDNFDGAFEPQIPVIAGEQYTIVIQNYTGSTSGFTIDYTGSGTAINYAPSASILNWSGTSSTAWALNANWGGCAIPACGVSAVIGALVPNFPVISANQSVNNLTIDAGATLTINAGVTLTVCGNFVNNGTLIMAPTATLLFNNTAAHTISGNLTGTNAIGNITVTQTAGSVTFMSDIDIKGNLTTSNATSIINSNNKYVKLAGNFVNAAGNTTYTNTGLIGALEFNGTAAQTYNQGSAQLDLNAVIMNHTSTGVTLLTNMYIKSTTGTLTLTAGKITTNAFEVNVANTANACVSTGNTTSYVNGNLRRYLAAGATGSFDFPVGNTANYERANLNFTTAAAAGAINLLARFDAWGGGWPNPGAPGWGPECAATYNVTYLDNGYWSIDASAASTGLYNTTLYNTGYTNAATGWSIAKSASGAPAWALQGTCQASPVTAVVRNAMTGFSKFATIQSSSPLPVQLLSFKGTNKTTFNELVWETATEEKVSGFELESSANAVDFKMIHSRSANGVINQSTSYKFNDYNFFSPVSYYRLKIINDDNAATYSSVIAIENKQKSQMVTKVFPNPAINEVNVSMEIPFDTEMRMEIKDLLGRIVYSKTMNVNAGNQEFNINTQELSQGTYVISTYIANLPETNNKLVISK